MSLSRNILWNIAAFVWFSLIIVLVTPYMIRRMGLELFGLWAIISAVNSYLTALDLGLANALIRFLAVENERRDRRVLQGYLQSGVAVMTGLGLLTSIALFLLSSVVVQDWVHVSPDVAGEAIASFRISAVAVFLGFLVGAYSAVPAALHRFDLLAFRTILLFSLQYLMIVLALQAGGGLLEVMYAFVLSNVCVLVYLIAISRHLLPGIQFWPGWNRAAAGELFRFGRMKFPAQVSVTLLQQFDRIALAVLLPVSMVSYYAVPVRVSQRLGQVAENVAGPFYPLVASYLVAGRTEELKRQYRLGSRIVLAAVCGALVVLGGLARPLLGVWLGNDFATHATGPLRVLLLAYGIGAMFTLPSVAADAAGRPGIPALFLVSGALVHMVVIWITVPRWGLVGAAIAVLCGFMIPVLLGVPIMHRRIRALPTLTDIFLDARGILLAAGVTLLLSFPLARALTAASGWIPLLMSLTACSVLYLCFLFAFRGLHLDDVRRVSRNLVSRPKVN
jgi:O-antigen/teichoic acid export membrane protein